MPKVEESEVEIAKRVIQFFEERDWDVYQEVKFRGSTADIVVTNGLVVGVIEVKKTLSLHLLGQARHWRPYAHLVWVAVPTPRSRSAQSLDGGSWVCEALGLGLIGVNKSNAVEKVQPTFQRKVKVKALREALRPEHKTFAKAGSRQGAWTPYKSTCFELAQYVHANPGVILKDALKAIKHHYKKDSTARVCMAKNLERGIVPGLTIRREDGALRIFKTP